MPRRGPGLSLGVSTVKATSLRPTPCSLPRTGLSPHPLSLAADGPAPGSWQRTAICTCLPAPPPGLEIGRSRRKSRLNPWWKLALHPPMPCHMAHTSETTLGTIQGLQHQIQLSKRTWGTVGESWPRRGHLFTQCLQYAFQSPVPGSKVRTQSVIWQGEYGSTGQGTQAKGGQAAVRVDRGFWEELAMQSKWT